MARCGDYAVFDRIDGSRSTVHGSRLNSDKSVQAWRVFCIKLIPVTCPEFISGGKRNNGKHHPIRLSVHSLEQSRLFTLLAAKIAHSSCKSCKIPSSCNQPVTHFRKAAVFGPLVFKLALSLFIVTTKRLPK